MERKEYEESSVKLEDAGKEVVRQEKGRAPWVLLGIVQLFQVFIEINNPLVKRFPSTLCVHASIGSELVEVMKSIAFLLVSKVLCFFTPMHVVYCVCVISCIKDHVLNHSQGSQNSPSVLICGLKVEKT